MTVFKDGSGGGNVAKVDSSLRIHTLAVTKPNKERATAVGDSYNINTGVIGLTSTTASGVLYFKNNETRDIVCESIAVGVGSAGTTTDAATVTLIRNPTTGTLISDATAVDMNQNRNFGSNNTLSDSLVYKGAEGKTVTDGDDIAKFFTTSPRLYAEINFVLPRGTSMALTIDTNTTTGTSNVYAAIICHLHDASQEL